MMGWRGGEVRGEGESGAEVGLAADVDTGVGAAGSGVQSGVGLAGSFDMGVYPWADCHWCARKGVHRARVKALQVVVAQGVEKIVRVRGFPPGGGRICARKGAHARDGGGKSNDREAVERVAPVRHGRRRREWENE